MNDWLQVHTRFTEILLRAYPVESGTAEDRARLKEVLVQLSESAAEGSSCLVVDDKDSLLLKTLLKDIPWFTQNRDELSGNKLVLLNKSHLYLNKYFYAEREIESALKSMAGKTEVIDGDAVKSKIENLVYMDAIGEKVILNTLRQNLSVISGGPGTGKTTIVVRVLALLIEHYKSKGNEDISIKILAPTGKAAARVKESIVEQKIQWVSNLGGFDKETIEAIPEVAHTVHKFLGINPRTRKSRYQKGTKAHVEIVIVDEASMLDILLVKELLAAMQPTTRLILLGDPYQLASVEAGNVLAQIIQASSLPGNEWLKGCCTELTISYRFGTDSGIGLLAAATNSGKFDEAMAILKNPEIPDVELGTIEGSHKKAIEGYHDYKEAVTTAKSQSKAGELTDAQIAAVFRAFDAWQVFSPYRHGAHGVEGLNQVIEDELGLAGKGEWYFGKPVLINTNDYSLKLSNGDIGICLDNKGKKVCFPAVDMPDDEVSQDYRYLSSRILPDHQPVYAMTVHKSQGSEYEQCLLVVPKPNENQKDLLMREILYTAITRAKKGFCIYAGEEEIRLMVGRKTERMSGLLLHQ